MHSSASDCLHNVFMARERRLALRNLPRDRPDGHQQRQVSGSKENKENQEEHARRHRSGEDNSREE